MTELQARNNLDALWQLKKKNGKRAGQNDVFITKHMAKINMLCGVAWDGEVAKAYIGSIWRA
jgi:hypothetical protein